MSLPSFIHGASLDSSKVQARGVFPDLLTHCMMIRLPGFNWFGSCAVRFNDYMNPVQSQFQCLIDSLPEKSLTKAHEIACFSSSREPEFSVILSVSTCSQIPFLGPIATNHLHFAFKLPFPLCNSKNSENSLPVDICMCVPLVEFLPIR